MDELKFRCPGYLAQRFWLLCAERNQTPGAVLRNYMVEEINKVDAGFSFDLRAATGQDVWSICEGAPAPREAHGD
jgi:hypothetical protein